MRNNVPRMKTPTPERECPESWHPWALFSVMVGIDETVSALLCMVLFPRGIDLRRILQLIVQRDGHLS